MPNRPELKFPKSFLWGVSTAAHQVEGGNHNQWSVWELENAKALAIRASYQFEDLDSWAFAKNAARTPSNYVSGDAIAHYKLYEQDFDLAKKMNLNAFRFSVEWSRVQPEEGAWNSEAIAHYKAYIAAMKKRGLEPVMTLFHFTLPVWFAQKGGFEKKSNIHYFVKFADRLLDEIGSGVRFVITINEPETYVYQGYVVGEWPPQKLSKLTALRVYRNLALAHNQIADVVHKKNRRYKLSISKNSVFVYAGDDAWLSRASAALAQYVEDDYFLKRVVKKCDFLGVNYYMDARIYGYRMHNPDKQLSDLGWNMEPQNIEFALKRLHDKYQLPMMITENGVADASDQYRKWWLMQTIMAARRAMNDGVELWGYLHWTLVDNFEWDKGYWPQFGFFAHDKRTGQRTPRPSALWFAKVVKQIRGI